MNKVRICGAIIFLFSFYSLYKIKDIPTCSDSGIGCQSMQEYMLASAPTLILTASMLYGFYIFLFEKEKKNNGK